MAISKRIRFEIFRRDNFQCRYCGLSAPEGAGLTIDHVVPVALGGSDAPDNLVAACKDCNAGKTSSSPDAPLVAQVGEDAVRWAAAMKRASDDLAIGHAQRKAYRSAFIAAWKTWDVPATWLDDEWMASLGQFQRAGLPIDVLTEDVDIAWGNRKIPARAVFRYLAGIAWNQITEMQEQARIMVGAQPARPPQPCGHCSGCELAADPDTAGEEYAVCRHVTRDVDDEKPCPKCGDPLCLYVDGVFEGEMGGWRDGYDTGRSREMQKLTPVIRYDAALATAIDNGPKRGFAIWNFTDVHESIAALEASIHEEVPF